MVSSATIHHLLFTPHFPLSHLTILPIAASTCEIHSPVVNGLFSFVAKMVTGWALFPPAAILTAPLTSG